jgi:hypothetical protein
VEETVVPTITEQQRSAINAAEGAAAIAVIDPVDQRTYYLVPAALYEQLHSDHASGGSEVSSAYPLMDDVARQGGWNDAEMDAYDRLDPRKRA